MAELIWDGKYDEHGNKRAPVRIELPFQTVETVNESAQDRQCTLELSASGHDLEWRNRLIWGDKKYVLPSLLPEFAAKWIWSTLTRRLIRAGFLVHGYRRGSRRPANG